MTKDRKILIGVIAVVVIILLITVFKGTGGVSDHQAVIEAKDETIKAIQGEREAWKISASEKQATIRELETRDSVLTIHFLNNQPKYIRIDEKIKSIPAFITRISGNDDSIRAAFANTRYE